LTKAASRTEVHKPLQTAKLSPCRRGSARCEAVVAAPLIVELRVRALVGLADQPGLKQLAHRAIERTGAESGVSSGEAGHLQHNPVAVLNSLSVKQRGSRPA
jgi:hypothetical protein